MTNQLTDMMVVQAMLYDALFDLVERELPSLLLGTGLVWAFISATFFICTGSAIALIATMAWPWVGLLTACAALARPDGAAGGAG